ncbi:hypothetical protein BN2364_3431 [Alloalcanivorax xenomutans]|nr:hypothetical protein BN2364_3431 [Alloalcanivorax xenomutans]
MINCRHLNGHLSVIQKRNNFKSKWHNALPLPTAVKNNNQD